MNIKNKKMYEYIIAAIIFIITIIVVSRSQQEQKDFKNDLLMTGKLTIGEVIFFQKSRGALFVKGIANNAGKRSKVSFYFTINDQKITNTYEKSHAYVPNDGIKQGDKYLVAYKRDDPNKNLMLFDYPIKDSTDFKRYVKEIKQMRKQEPLKKKK